MIARGRGNAKLLVTEKEVLMKQDPNKVIVRKSYYTFSKEYPAGKIDTGQVRRRSRSRKKTVVTVLLLAVLFCAVLAATFFWTDLSLKISNRPIETETQAAAVTNEDGAIRTILNAGDVRALWVPVQTIADRTSVRKSIKQLRHLDCDSVILDFKTQDGHLLYASLEQAALLAKCSLFSNDTVRTAIKQYQNAGIRVIARVFCFEDPLIAARNPAYAVTYMDTQVPWLDKKEEAGGKAWLNPYSGKARAYLLSLLKEISAFQLSGVILESVCFPDSDNLDSATFPGESGGAARSGVLTRFLEKARNAVPEGRFLLVGMTADDLRRGNDTRYDGRLTSDKIDGYYVHTSGAVDLTESPIDYEIPINAFTSLQSRAASGQCMMLDIPRAEFKQKYARLLNQNGFSLLAISEDAPQTEPEETTDAT